VKSIPKNPQIPLSNYLLDLVSDSDGKESSLYLNGMGAFIQSIWTEMVKTNWRTLNVRKFIPQKLGIHHVGFYSYKNGKRAIAIQMLYKLLLTWKEICGKTDKELTNKWGEVFKSNFTVSVAGQGRKATLPKSITPKLSYLIGWICGDGHLSDYGNHYLIKISEKSTDQLSLILKPLFWELFGIEPPIFQRYQNGYALQVGSKPVFRFLTQALKVKVGTIPNFVKGTDNTNKKYFLCGIFDAEGHITQNYLDSRIVISQANRKFLQKISFLFSDLNIKFNNPYLHKTNLGEWYTISIRRKAVILKFAKNIGSLHIDKSQKLRRLVKVINENWHR
jgi:DNA-binding transcriptional regulator WhiA